MILSWVSRVNFCIFLLGKNLFAVGKSGNSHSSISLSPFWFVSPSPCFARYFSTPCLFSPIFEFKSHHYDDIMSRCCLDNAPQCVEELIFHIAYAFSCGAWRRMVVSLKSLNTKRAVMTVRSLAPS